MVLFYAYDLDTQFDFLNSRYGVWTEVEDEKISVLTLFDLYHDEQRDLEIRPSIPLVKRCTTKAVDAKHCLLFVQHWANSAKTQISHRIYLLLVDLGQMQCRLGNSVCINNAYYVVASNLKNRHEFTMCALSDGTKHYSVGKINDGRLEILEDVAEDLYPLNGCKMIDGNLYGFWDHTDFKHADEERVSSFRQLDLNSRPTQSSLLFDVGELDEELGGAAFCNSKCAWSNSTCFIVRTQNEVKFDWDSPLVFNLWLFDVETKLITKTLISGSGFMHDLYLSDDQTLTLKVRDLESDINEVHQIRTRAPEKLTNLAFFAVRRLPLEPEEEDELNARIFEDLPDDLLPFYMDF